MILRRVTCATGVGAPSSSQPPRDPAWAANRAPPQTPAPASRDLKLELSFTHELLELHPALQAQDGRVRAFTNLAPEEGLAPLLVQLRAAA